MATEDPDIAALRLEQEFEIQRQNEEKKQNEQRLAELTNEINSTSYNIRQQQIEPDTTGYNIRQQQIEPDSTGYNIRQQQIEPDDNSDNYKDQNRYDGQGEQNRPNKRLKNPLGKFSSVTYQLTLYMITADAYNAFIQSGRKNINIFKDWENSGTYIVAQSGGVDTKEDDRPPGLKYDYYIDELNITSQINAKTTQTATNITKFSFNIHEPYGFSFINKLAQAHNILKSKTKLPVGSGLGYNPSRQFFVLGIRYLGYDEMGNIVNKESDLGLRPQFENESEGIFENFFDIYITNIKFNIASNSSTVYNVTAAPITTIVPYGYKYGRLSNGAEIVASNVYDALLGDSGVISRLNKEEQSLKDSNSVEIPNEYDVKFVGPEGDISLIKDAVFYNESDKIKKNWPMSLIKNTSGSNQYVALKSEPDSSKRILAFSKDISIMQVVESTIKQSTYLYDALRQIYDSEIELTNNKKSKPEINENPRVIKWYNLTADVKCKGWDKKRNDWAYKITYLIQPYDTPCILSPFVKNVSNYYGPHKRYDFYYTGKNSEILSYSHAINNQWLNAEATLPKSNGNDDGTSTPNVSNKLTGGDRTGKVDIGLEAQNNFVNNLYDPKSWVNARIQILGDPDFLIRENAADINDVYRQYYGSDFTINANSGQVFIEIDFKEGVDYDHSKGLMNINEQLTFWRYTDDVKQYVNGVSYMVLSVESTFSRGKFVQNLSCVINSNIVVKSKEKTSPNDNREEKYLRDNDIAQFGLPDTSVEDDDFKSKAMDQFGISDFNVSDSINNSSTNTVDLPDELYLIRGLQQNYVGEGRE
jgi:hypothetical protein